MVEKDMCHLVKDVEKYNIKGEINMALNNGRFKGIIDGKCARDYRSPNGNITTLDGRKKEIIKVFNLDKYGISKDEYILNIWDSGCNSSNLNKDGTLWTDTQTAKKFEQYGTYLINCEMDSNERKYEPKKLDLSENVSNEDVAYNDKNYRLAPKEDIHKSDYQLPRQFRGTYEDYLKIHKKNMKKLEDKFSKYNKKRYGCDDGIYEYSKDTLMTREQWERWRDKYKQKVELLKGVYNGNKELTYHALYDIFKEQMSRSKKKENIQYNKQEQVHIKLDELDLPLSIQLNRMGLNSDKMVELENNASVMTRNTNVTLSHIRESIANHKDMGISIKLAYSPRIKIDPPKCSVNSISLDDIDYCEKIYIGAMIKLPMTDLRFDNDMSVLSYDLHKMIKKLYKKGKLNDRDLYILEGVRYNIPQEDLAKELNIEQPTLNGLIKRIVNTITNGFIEDKEDLIYLNKYKGEYKTCVKCGEVKLIQKFNKNGKYIMSICKDCDLDRKK